MFSEKEIEEIIDKAPTVEVDEMTQDLINKVNVNIGLAKPIKDERPQGEWVAHEDMDEWYECNKCHCGNTYFDKLPNFCPNCGAKMDGGAE